MQKKKKIICDGLQMTKKYKIKIMGHEYETTEIAYLLGVAIGMLSVTIAWLLYVVL